MQTTESRAKEIRPLIEKFITLSRENTVNNRRQLLEYIYNEKAVKKLLDEIGPNYAKRNGGYTRIMRIGQRVGDCAEMVIIELV